MEFPSVGAKCTQENCKQLDFLPHICGCGKSFCLEHFSKHSLGCQFVDNTVTELKFIEEVFICSENECKDRSVIPLLCEKCKKHYCIKHRHIGECIKKTEDEYKAAREQLAAPMKQYSIAKSNVDKEITENIESAKKNDKKRKLACKVQLMRLKNKAVGLKSIPSTDRVYFNIILPSKLEKAVFISNTWTVGRTIDAIAELCELQNNNNKSGELKLRLFKIDKTIISSIMSDHIRDLLRNETIIDGENLIIEYVDDKCLLLS